MAGGELTPAMARDDRDRRRIDLQLTGGEDVLAAGRVQFTTFFLETSVNLLAKPTRARPDRPDQRQRGSTGVTGEPGSLARTMPMAPGVLWMAVTDRRLLLGPILGPTDALLWEIDRTRVAGVEPRPRLEVLARFRLHFTDSSSVALLTPRRRTVDAFGEVLGYRS